MFWVSKQSKLEIIASSWPARALAGVQIFDLVCFGFIRMNVSETVQKWENVLEFVPKCKNVYENFVKLRNVLEIVSKWTNNKKKV